MSYSCHVEHHISPALGSVPLERIDAQAINRLYAQLLADGRRKGRGGLSSSTVQRIHATLHRALRDAVRWGLVRENPVDRSDPPRQLGGREVQTWTPVELRRFLRSVRDDAWYALWHVLAFTGLRRGEALGLRWKDVDLGRRKLAVRQTLIAVGYEIRLSTPKTKRGRRVVMIDDMTTKVLSDHREGAASGDLVFCDGDGSPLHPCRVTRRFSALVRACGLPAIRLHDLRHTHATIALAAGVHPKIVSERLGHATVTITLDLYSHVTESMQAEAAGVVSRAVFPATNLKRRALPARDSSDSVR